MSEADLRSLLSLSATVVEAARRVRTARSGTRTEQQRASAHLDAALDAFDHARSSAARAAE